MLVEGLIGLFDVINEELLPGARQTERKEDGLIDCDKVDRMDD